MSFNLKAYNTFGLDVEATYGFVINDFVMFDMAFKKIKEYIYGSVKISVYTKEASI